MSRTFLLQDWVTIRGGSSLASLVQDEERWLDLDGYSDATCWIDVAEVTPGAGSSLTISLETAAVCDDAYFTAMIPPVSYGAASPFNVASTTPLVARSIRSATTSNLMRYVRWKITPSTGGALWDITFRVRVVATRTPAFSPLDLSSCQLWLRGDMGLTFNGANVSQWNDQSGNGRNASQSTVGTQPPYATAAVSGMPALTGDGANMFMTTTSFNVGTSASFFTVVQPLVTTQTTYARIFEQDNVTSYYFGTNAAGTGYKLIVANNVSPFGHAETGTVQLAPSIVSATYDAVSGKGTIYYNGASPISDTFANPAGSLPVYLMRKASLAQEYWNGYLAEVLMYGRALTPQEVTRVHRYLGARYNIAVP